MERPYSKENLDGQILQDTYAAPRTEKSQLLKKHPKTSYTPINEHFLAICPVSQETPIFRLK